jgi:hypothetical protein
MAGGHIMATHAYELWDLSTGNMIDAFDGEQKALAAVRDAIDRHGRAYVESWALAHATLRTMRSLGEGPTLIERALRAGPTPTRATGTQG